MLVLKLKKKKQKKNIVYKKVMISLEEMKSNKNIMRTKNKIISFIRQLIIIISTMMKCKKKKNT